MKTNELVNFIDHLIELNFVKNKTDFATKLGYSREHISRLLSKKDADVPMELIIRIKYHFEGEFKKNFETKTPEQTDTEDVIITKAGMKYEPLPDGEYLLTVDLVPIEAHAAYIMGNVDKEDEWEKVTFKVDRIGKGKYLAFRVKGHSFFNTDQPGYYDIRDKDVVLVRELGKQHWRDGFNKNKAPYGWIIAPEETYGEPVLKDIIDFDKNDGKILCHSRNPSIEYADFWWDLDKTHSIYKVITVMHTAKGEI
ncbi:MAG: hypothetical protein BGO31_14370 [Bacteroidetes bacterium 43-16]|nr:MAG: hypothetical protein BGO31_14370 [Bacteroidetes bacterium 43-16]